MFARLSFIAFAIIAPVLSFGLGSDASNTPNSKQIRWQGRNIKIYISSSLSATSRVFKQQTEVNGALLRALQRWEEAASVDFELATTDISAISPPGMTGDGISVITIGQESENLLAFAGKRANASALTRVFYDSRGVITEADIALNPSQQFTTDGTPGTFDLEAVFAHEIGHLLGLSHSLAPAAVMFDGVPRNGGEIPGLFRSLSRDDISKARRLYGTSDIDVDCCAAIVGRFDRVDMASKSMIWAQDTTDGSMVQLTGANAKGSFEIGGLQRGSYEVLTQNSGDERPLLATTSSSIIADENQVNVAIASSRKTVSFDLRFVGVNGQLSRRAISVLPGQSYRIILAGTGIMRSDLRFGTTASGISLDPTMPSSSDFGKQFPSLTFDLAVARTVRHGVYSIYAEDRNGLRRYFVGGLSVE